jgi:hypothetical protein
VVLLDGSCSSWVESNSNEWSKVEGGGIVRMLLQYFRQEVAVAQDGANTNVGKNDLILHISRRKSQMDFL